MGGRNALAQARDRWGRPRTGTDFATTLHHWYFQRLLIVVDELNSSPASGEPPRVNYPRWGEHVGQR
jgi:hypothetical protein